MSRTRTRVSEGSPYPLGATYDGRGVNFAVFSAHATRMEVCLFEADGRESARVPLPEHTDEIWHGTINGLKAGQLYGLRAHGPYEPKAGHRFNPHKLLIDPYARLLKGDIAWNDAHFAYKLADPAADLSFDETDSAPFMPKCVVMGPRSAPRFPFPPLRQKQRKPVPWTDTVVYEAHVKGLTALHPGLPEAIRGTFAGLGHPRTIDHLRRLGITTVELLPVQCFFDDRYLVEKKLHNYWGYSTACFFAPANRYLSAANDPAEIRTAIERLHDAGLEVILDVVYNHTAEGNHLGPTLSFRGLDNASYYKLADDARFNFDTTGCGNTLNVGHPRVLQMIMDSLRYWVEEYQVDGFRFDLASTLGRDNRQFNPNGSLFTALGQDPVLSRTKLISEPWDLGEGGYQVGNFPPGWAEWNGPYRDDMRSYWRGNDGMLPALASRLLGSANLFEKRGRRPWASVNFVTAHDGFTLADLYAFNGKHNEANQENNADGSDDNRSWNCGVEGNEAETKIMVLRQRMRRNMMASLMFSQGTPMLLMGDEVGRTQNGNNNAYCQDNEISWMKWRDLDAMDESLFAFVRGLIELRRRTPLLRQAKFLHGEQARKGLKNVTWLRADGKEMTPADWSNGLYRSVAMQLADGTANALLLFTNAYHEGVSFKVPSAAGLKSWRLLVDTGRGLIEPPEPLVAGGSDLVVEGRAQLLFEARKR